MNRKSALAAGMLLALAACSNQEVNNAMKSTTAWAGKFTLYTEVPGADDGTDSYDLEIKQSGDGYDVTYTHTSMRYATYKGRGTETQGGELKVVFTGFDSNLTYLKNFKPGNHMFTLKRVKQGDREGVKLDWEMVPGDDIRKKSVTMFPPEPPNY